jgi:sarcosine oxidase subunit beta
MNPYDVIVVGAGSIGVPTAMALGAAGLRTLVLDMRPSPGQGDNKHAIGGIRATHSAPAKIVACERSLEIFSTWRENHGDDIEWQKGGYIFPVYRETEETVLKGYLPVQQQYGLNIAWVGPAEMAAAVPGINRTGLRGGTIAPDDGSASPLLAVNAFYRRACALGVTFRFKEKVARLMVEAGRVVGAATDQGEYRAPTVIDAAGAFSGELARSTGCQIPVLPESHEAGITEPVEMFCPAMIVDLRPAAGSKNYYFYQNRHGQIVFCITPDPPISGTDIRSTSVFLPQCCGRMIDLMPRLKNIRVRRVWRGTYPMTSDGSPLVGANREMPGLIHATGMCGQGFMLGPGIGEVVAHLVTESLTANDRMILEAFSPYRDLTCQVEALK